MISFESAQMGQPEVKRMTATTTNIFGPLDANLVESDQVAEQHARERVPDHREPPLCLDERVPTPASVFSRFRSRFHNVNAMAKEPTAVVNFLLEFVMTRIRIAS